MMKNSVQYPFGPSFYRGISTSTIITGGINIRILAFDTPFSDPRPSGNINNSFKYEHLITNWEQSVSSNQFDILSFNPFYLSAAYTNIEQIKIAQKAEHDFVGTKCGIMDQFAVMMGEEKKFILLNCETLEYKLIDAEINPFKIILINTNVEHNLAASEYNLRRKECEEAMRVIRLKHPDFYNLAEVPIEVIKTFENELDELVFKRATYVAEEEKRTKDASKFMQNGELIKFGELMYASHEGLSTKYDVSCPELDFLVNYSKKYDSVIGARMMGGGFGGCTINLIHEDFVNYFTDSITKAYKSQFDLELSILKTEISKGVSLIKSF